jgi:hypothetical protein
MTEWFCVLSVGITSPAYDNAVTSATDTVQAPTRAAAFDAVYRALQDRFPRAAVSVRFWSCEPNTEAKR